MASKSEEEGVPAKTTIQAEKAEKVQKIKEKKRTATLAAMANKTRSREERNILCMSPKNVGLLDEGINALHSSPVFTPASKLNEITASWNWHQGRS